MKSKMLGLLAVGLLAGPMAAQAAYIVDTGPGTGGCCGKSATLNNQGVSFQHLGVSFSVAPDSSITGVGGWIGATEGTVPEPGTLALLGLGLAGRGPSRRRQG